MRTLSLFAGMLRGLSRRWPEIRAALGWVLLSWLHPAASDADWQQGQE